MEEKRQKAEGDRVFKVGEATNILIRYMQDRMASEAISIGVDELDKGAILEALKKMEGENLNPVVEFAQVECSEMDAKGPIVARKNTLIVDVRNGAAGLTIDDVLFEPGSFGYCKAMKKECRPEFLTKKWENGDKKNLINGRPALTMDSYLICIAGNGMITPLTDGQVLDREEAVFEMELRRKGFPKGYIVQLMKLHEKYPNWEFDPVFTGVDYQEFVNYQMDKKYKCAEVAEYSTKNDYEYEVDSRYKDASEEAIVFFTHPYSMLQTNDMYEYCMQFLKADQELPQEYIDKAVDKILMNKDSQIVEAIKKSDECVNPVFMASVYKYENGPAGTEYNGQTIYNLFNIGANSGAEDGKRYAYEQGWFTVEECIAGSEEEFQRYLDRGQNTLYALDWHFQGYREGKTVFQYATLVNDAANKAKGLSQLGDEVDLNQEFIFSIPIYDSLPTYNNEQYAAFPDPKGRE